jgi:hypothetical protein
LVSDGPKGKTYSQQTVMAIPLSPIFQSAKTYQFFYNASLEEVTHEENNKQ